MPFAAGPFGPLAVHWHGGRIPPLLESMAYPRFEIVWKMAVIIR